MTSAHRPLAPDAPIGVFDSGVGGLDVAAELTLSLPHERLIYLGDGARVPYGTRTPEEVKRFTEEALITLLKLGVKAVVLACNTASAWALDELSQRYHVPIFGMIEAGVTATESVARALPPEAPRGVLILATPRTIDSSAYQRCFRAARNQQLGSLTALACPVFVPLVEAGWADSQISVLSASRYLQELIEREGEGLREELGIALLGCTHYPLLRGAILEGFQRVLGRPVSVVDGARHVAIQLKERLEREHALAPAPVPGTPVPSERHMIFTTGDPEQTRALAERFWRARLGRALPPLRSISINERGR